MAFAAGRAARGFARVFRGSARSVYGVAASSQEAQWLWKFAGAVAGGVTAGYVLTKAGVFSKPYAAAGPQPQPSVISQTKQHALYLWIHLEPTANSKQCAKKAASLQKLVNTVVPPADRDDDNEIWAGVGFGPNFYHQVTGHCAPHNYTYAHRKGALGDMPSTGGDIFIHAKSDRVSSLFELSQLVQREMPKGSVKNVSETYGWVYRNGRDLSGFIDGTENPADEDDRMKVAVGSDGSSYVITQRWIHKHDVIQNAKVADQEKWVGRSKSDSTELKKKPATSHVARMVGGTGFGQPKAFEIVRQSQPYGTASGDSGLFFIGYAAHPQNFEFMLNRMVGAEQDGLCDDVMRLTSCVAGNYWYFPSVEELSKMA